MPHVINSRASIGEKPCINKAIQMLLMHGYATFSMPVPVNSIAAITRCILLGPRMSIVHGNSVSTTSVKAKQNSARNNAKCSKCFQFLCNNSNRTWFCSARSLGGVENCGLRPLFSTPPTGPGKC